MLRGATLRDDEGIDPELTSLFREYRFRKAFGGSHEDFLEQPSEVAEWLLAIDGIMRDL